MIMQSNKAQVVSQISKMTLSDGEVIDNEMGVPSVLIIYTMCVVNMVTKTVVVVNHRFTSLLGTKGFLSDIVIR